MTTIRPANDTDLPALLALRDEARQWLSARGSDQWSHAWPDPDTMAATIADGIHRGETWCVDGDDGSVIATFTVTRSPYPGLWTDEEQRQPALYVHRLIVARSMAHRGLGAELLDKVTQCAAKRGDLPGYPSGAIFERSAT
jgi:hypothetical protein